MGVSPRIPAGAWGIELVGKALKFESTFVRLLISQSNSEAFNRMLWSTITGVFLMCGRRCAACGRFKSDTKFAEVTKLSIRHQIRHSLISSCC